MSDVNETLRVLHTAVAEELLKRIKEGTAKPQDLAVATKFLKDNNIDALPTSGSPLANLTEVLGDDLFAGPDDLLN